MIRIPPIMGGFDPEGPETERQAEERNIKEFCRNFCWFFLDPDLREEEFKKFGEKKQAETEKINPEGITATWLHLKAKPSPVSRNREMK